MQVLFPLFSIIICHKISNLIDTHYALMMSHVVLFAYPIKLDIWIKNTVTKILPKTLYCEFKLSFQCNKKNT